jgi:16S rRNA (uracil1498-N3)-methyltransferase
MPKERFFIPELFAPGSHVSLSKEETHHLVRVMRAHEGDVVELVNGMGQLASARVDEVHRNEVVLTALDVSSEPKPLFEVILAQAIPRMNRLENILEKGTELGMTQLWLFPGQLSEKKTLSDAQMERAQAITIAALKQSGRLFLPTITLLPKLESWNALSLRAFYGDPSPEAMLFARAWRAQQPSEGCLFFVGPEAGFSDKEVQLLSQLGAEGVRLHQNILRTDTAPLVALSLIQHWMLEQD